MGRFSTHFVALVTTLVLGGCGFSPSQPGISGVAARGGGGNNTGSGGGSQTGGGGNMGSGNPDSNCGVVERPVNRLPPEVLIVLDASGSMNQDVANAMCTGGCGANSKWAQMVPAISQVVQATDANVNWGLKFFADTDAECGVSPNTVAVGVAPNTGAAVQAAITGRTDAAGNVSMGSRTPTRRAEDAAVTYFNALPTDNPKYIMLATDGQPNCTGTNGSNTNADDNGAIMAVQRAMTAGYPTFVVGIATAGGAADTALTGMANAGGLPRVGQSPPYYPVTTGSELVTALNALVTAVATCTFPVPEPPNSQTNRNNITVWVNGQPITRSATAGWEYGAGGVGTVVITGPLCDQIMAGTITDVKIIFDCVVG